MLKNRRRIIVYAMLFLYWYIGFMDRVNIAIAAKPIASEFHLSPVGLGYLFSSFGWSYVICLLPVGIMTDRWGARRIAAAAMGIWSVAQICTGFTFGFGSLIAARMALGAGESPANAVSTRVVAEWSPMSERGVAMSAFIVASYAGIAFGAPFVAWLVSHFGWRPSFIVTGLMGMIWGLVWLLFFRTPEKTTWIGDEEKQMILRERGAGGDDFEDRDGLAGVLFLLKQRTIWGATLTEGCIIYMLFLFSTWLPSYLQMTRGFSIMKAGIYTSIPYVVTVFLAIFFCRISDLMLSPASVRAGHRRRFVAGAMILSSAVLGVQFVHSLWAIITLITIGLVFSATAAATNFAMLSDLLRIHNKTGKAFSIVAIGGNVFGLMAPIITGYIVQRTGSFNMAFNVVGILALIGAGIVMTTTSRPVEEQNPSAHDVFSPAAKVELPR
jgi:MFS family permease